MSDSSDISRRSFLGAVAAFAATTLAPGIMLYARSPNEPVTNAVRWGMLVDASQCDKDCNGCVEACNNEFGLVSHGRPETDPQWIRKVDGDRSGHRPHASRFRSCASTATIRPASTSVRPARRSNGPTASCWSTVTSASAAATAMMACPYKARNFVHEAVTDQKPYAPRGKGTSEACTMCVHRVDAGRTPACVEACSKTGHAAMLFGDLNDPNSEIAKRVAAVNTSQIRADLRTDPGVRYQGM